MRTPNEIFTANHEELLSQGMIISSAADGSSITIEGRQQDTAVVLARALTERLEREEEAVYNDDRFSFFVSSDLGEAIEASEKNKRTMFSTNPGQKAFSVKLESGSGQSSEPYVLRAEVREKSGEFDAADTMKLQLGYISMMNTLKLKPKDPLEESFEDVIKQVEVEVHGSNKAVLDVREQREVDIREAPQTLKLLGVKDASDTHLLRELWTDRSLDRVALIDLYFNLMNKKREIIGSANADYYPDITLLDLVQTGRHLPATSLRASQQEESTKILVDIGFDPKDIDRRFSNADRDRSLGFRYTAWLIEQPFMKDFRRSLKGALVAGDRVPTIKLFLAVTSEVFNAYRNHKDDEDRQYDVSIDWQDEQYRRKLEFLKTCSLLCMNIFFDKDVSGLLGDR